ncbi:hypothetical protein XU18_3503 [Perkinsela sp. CCAP 1560/4]|nr:hypothetical protein XU18_3503 [Perkinsela sp. CCAP 1560/4]|eukprot:KNH05532.1 hypothetical protein XU18_3503 [Perkinsela sp. CCAP 1560/4]
MSETQVYIHHLNAPKLRSFPGDDCVLDFGSLTGDASVQSSGNLTGAQKIEHSTEPPQFLKARANAINKALPHALRSSILARRYTMGDVQDNQTTTIEPLAWANIVGADPTGKTAHKETLSILNLSAALPGITNVKFLSKDSLIALPHCVAYDVRTVRPGPTRTPESVLGIRTGAHEEPRFSTDVPEVYCIHIHLGYHQTAVSIEDITYHTLTPFVKRPHAFTCVTNSALSDRHAKRPAQYMIVGGELMPACAGETETVLGVHFIDLASHELTHSVALSTDSAGDMISSIELALLPQTVIVTLRYGGIYVLQGGRISHHIAAPYGSNGCLTSCSAMDAQFIAARGLSGKYFIKSFFTRSGEWDYLKTIKCPLRESRCAVNLPSPALLVGCPMRMMHARKLVTTINATIVESSEIPPTENPFAPFLRVVTAYSNYYYADEPRKLFLEKDKRYTVLYGTIGGEVIVALNRGTKANLKNEEVRVLQLFGGSESNGTDRTLKYSLSNRINQRTSVRSDVPVESVPSVDSLKEVTIEQVCCFPVRNVGNIVAVHTAGGLLLLFGLDMHGGTSGESKRYGGQRWE